MKGHTDRNAKVYAATVLKAIPVRIQMVPVYTDVEQVFLETYVKQVNIFGLHNEDVLILLYNRSMC